MTKKRFFATLHFARGIRRNQADYNLKRLVTKTFYYGYTLGWKERP